MNAGLWRSQASSKRCPEKPGAVGPDCREALTKYINEVVQYCNRVTKRLENFRASDDIKT